MDNNRPVAAPPRPASVDETLPPRRPRPMAAWLATRPTRASMRRHAPPNDRHLIFMSHGGRGGAGPAVRPATAASKLTATARPGSERGAPVRPSAGRRPISGGRRRGDDGHANIAAVAAHQAHQAHEAHRPHPTLRSPAYLPRVRHSPPHFGVVATARSLLSPVTVHPGSSRTQTEQKECDDRPAHGPAGALRRDGELRRSGH